MELPKCQTSNRARSCPVKLPQASNRILKFDDTTSSLRSIAAAQDPQVRHSSLALWASHLTRTKRQDASRGFIPRFSKVEEELQHLALKSFEGVCDRWVGHCHPLTRSSPLQKGLHGLFKNSTLGRPLQRYQGTDTSRVAHKLYGLTASRRSGSLGFAAVSVNIRNVQRMYVYVGRLRAYPCIISTRI